MATFSTSTSTVRFDDTAGEVTFTATRPAVTFTAAYQSVVGSGGGSTEVFRSDYYVSGPLATFDEGDGPPTITDGVLTWPGLAGTAFPFRIMLDDPGLGADRGIYVGVEDPGNPGFSGGTFPYAPEDEQPYRTGNENAVGSFGLDVINDGMAIGPLLHLGGEWAFVAEQAYNASGDWPDPGPETVGQALNLLASRTLYDPAPGTGNLPEGADSVQALADVVDTLPVGGASIDPAIVDGKGELIVGSAADTVDNLAAGTNTHVLTADSTQPLGVKWAAPAAGGTSFPTTPRISGYWYSLLGGESANSNSMIAAAGVLKAHPVWLPAGTYDRLAVTTTVAAVQTLRLGVYPNNPTTMLPDGETLILDAGTINMNATAGQLPTGAITLTIATAGIYWFACLCDAYTATPTGWGWRGQSGESANVRLPWLGQQAYGMPGGRGGWAREKTGVTTGAMPATFPAANITDSRVPQIYARAS
jgi:hypothetical protein